MTSEPISAVAALEMWPATARDGKVWASAVAEHAADIRRSLDGWTNEETRAMWRWLTADGSEIRAMATYHLLALRKRDMPEEQLPEYMALWLHTYCENVWAGEYEEGLGQYTAAGRYELKYGAMTRDVGRYQRLDCKALMRRFLEELT